MDYGTFITKFPEWQEVPKPMVELVLAETLTEFDAAVWKHLLDRGHGYLTAHTLSISPAGRAARLQAEKDGKTTYWTEYDRLRTIAAMGVGRVSGGTSAQ